MRTRLALPTLLFCASSALITGCGVPAHSTAPVTIPTGMRGAVHGGQQPVAGATIQLYAVGTTGDGSPSTPLITSLVRTDSNGNFTITGDYTCPDASTLVYMTATGGQPLPNVTNPQLALMVALGTCGTLTASTIVHIDERTTVAAVYQFAPFMTSYAAVGASTADQPVLANAFSLATQLVDVPTGTVPSANMPGGIIVPTTQLNTVADILASCINSSGGVSGDGSTCGNFFSWTTPTGGIVPTDAIGALLNLANNPSLNTASLFSLISADAPYTPADSTQPADLSIAYGLLERVSSFSDWTGAVSTLNTGKTGGTIVVTPGSSISMTSTMTISTPMTIICMAGSSVSAAVGGSLIVVTGNNVTVENCTFTDTGQAANSSLFVIKAAQFLLQNSSVTDTNTNSSALAINSPSSYFTLLNNTITGLVHMQGATQGLFKANTITGIIFGEDNTTYIQAIGNTITTGVNGGSSLQFHGTASGNTVSNLTLTGNHLTQSGTYCIEVGAFGVGTIPPVNVVASNNTCDLGANGTSGGYSFDTVIAPVITNNIFNADGHTSLVAGVEIVNSYITGVSGPTGPGTGAIVRGNTLNGAGISLNKQSNNTVDSNYIDMVTKTGAMFIGGVDEHSDNNVVTNNTFVCSGCVSGTTYRIIWMQNTPGKYPATIIGNQITGNTFIGKNAGEFGIWLENDDTSTSTQTSDFDQTTISKNIFQNVTNDIHPQKDSENIYLDNNTCGQNSTWLPAPVAGVTIHGETTFCTNPQ